MSRYKIKYIDGAYQIWDSLDAAWILCDDNATIWRCYKKFHAINRLRELQAA